MMSAQPIFAPRSGWGWGMFEGACEGSRAAAHWGMRSLDCARKLAPLGMTVGVRKLAPLGMTVGVRKLVPLGMTVGGVRKAPLSAANGLVPLGMTIEDTSLEVVRFEDVAAYPRKTLPPVHS